MSPARIELIIVALALLSGLAVALAAALLAGALAAIPPEDRSYKDAPPLGFRLFWWPIHCCGHALRPFISRAPTASLPVRLRKAGLDYSISPAQFTAARLLCALGAAAASCWVLDSLGKASASGGFGVSRYWEAGAAGALCGWLYLGVWLRDCIARRKSELHKTLPFYLDLITLCVEAGLNLPGALNQAALKGPKGTLCDEIKRVLRDVRNGKVRADALRAMSERVQEPAVSSFITAMIQAERIGMNLGPVLRAQADQRRSERFLRAEKLAMEAPVKLLFPLIAFIFPCTFIVLFFPIVIQFMHSGL
ncbi:MULTISPECIES: type II secretion system F family protein [unclassified Janthinobacterium]|uniref:type II secretion system F family protein n=1 Tax=unclassified Janthinobacterium TaxID=2610881 RepID=UPI001610381B|nr:MULTISPECIES: type II secretion system F family protein [unclassified Janthinobacterium]MBB5606645.1 tight adherence protein C [Janthinobacterium sp. S3T4]MBB5612305.1 tight adherence protein C [Janthinobacterium sp. S3M3]